jgi:diaminohydroxyphosphoribosylaminopyrimidine deaminase/5-amino-6-(5-phosphoribosylamino)uracil reductase
MHEIFIKRCLDLARQGNGKVSPNPMVGAVIVHDSIIIGEGFHQQFGKAHAEVNAVQNVPLPLRHLLPKSTLYVSLEPCCFFGKTPPCTELILEQRLPKVVVSCLDATPNVNGKGIEILRSQGVEVITGVLEAEGKRLVEPRAVYATKERPYIVLKLAVSRDGFIGKPNKQIWLSNPYTQRLVHKWRSEVDGILVGTNTARVDNPKLNNRYYFGSNPIRIILDKHNNLSDSLYIKDKTTPTLIITEKQVRETEWDDNLTFLHLPFDDELLPNLLKVLHERKIGVLLVEGGALLISSFLKLGCWDEARIIQTPNQLGSGIAAPLITAPIQDIVQIESDILTIYTNEG